MKISDKEEKQERKKSKVVNTANEVTMHSKHIESHKDSTRNTAITQRENAANLLQNYLESSKGFSTFAETNLQFPDVGRSRQMY